MKLENMKACLQGGGTWFHWCLRPTQPPTLGHQNGEITQIQIQSIIRMQIQWILYEVCILFLKPASIENSGRSSIIFNEQRKSWGGGENTKI